MGSFQHRQGRLRFIGGTQDGRDGSIPLSQFKRCRNPLQNHCANGADSGNNGVGQAFAAGRKGNAQTHGLAIMQRPAVQGNECLEARASAGMGCVYLGQTLLQTGLIALDQGFGELRLGGEMIMDRGLSNADGLSQIRIAEPVKAP